MIKPNFADIDAQRGIFDLMLEQASGKIRRRKTVRLCHLADIIDRYEPAASAHRLHRHRRLAGNMLGQMLGENA